MAEKAATRTRKMMTIVYEDGSVESLNPNRPALLVALEREHKVSSPQTIEQGMWLAWAGLGRPGEFDEWLGRVSEIDTRDEVVEGKVSSMSAPK